MGNEFIRGVESDSVDFGNGRSGIEIETPQDRSDFDSFDININFDHNGDRSSFNGAIRIEGGERRRSG